MFSSISTYLCRQLDLYNVGTSHAIKKIKTGQNFNTSHYFKAPIRCQLLEQVQQPCLHCANIV